MTDCGEHEDRGGFSDDPAHPRCDLEALPSTVPDSERRRTIRAWHTESEASEGDFYRHTTASRVPFDRSVSYGALNRYARRTNLPCHQSWNAGHVLGDVL